MKDLAWLALVVILPLGCAAKTDDSESKGGTTHDSIADRKMLKRSRDYRPTLRSKATVEELNAIAGNEKADRNERCIAVFTLFSNHVNAGADANRFGHVFAEKGWIEESLVHGAAFFSNIPISRPIDETENVFRLHVLPMKKGPWGDFEWSDYVVYFKFSGKRHPSFADFRTFLRGATQKNPLTLREFSLCFPDDKIEHFSSSGARLWMHADKREPTISQ